MSIANNLYNRCMTTDHWWPNLLYKIVCRWNRFRSPDKKVSVHGIHTKMKRPDGTEYFTGGTVSMARLRQIDAFHRMESTNWRAMADQEKKRSRGE